VTAPPGYGKTTLLSQWAKADRRPVVWLSVDKHDNDPSALLTYLAAGLDRIRPIDPRVFRELASPTVPVLSAVVPRLLAALQASERPALLVLDDLHLLNDVACLDAVGALAAALPEGTQLAFGSRSDPAIPLAWLRAQGRLLEIGPTDLALDEEEAAALFRAVGPDLNGVRVKEILRRTEGWATGLYLAGLSMRSGGDPELVEPFSGEDRFVADYLRSEILSEMPAKDLRFLTRTSVLDRMCGPLCDGVTGTRGSTGTLERLERSYLFLVPLDRHREWYRYHPLFRDALRAELERREPGAAPELQRRAAGWHEEHGGLDIAVEYWLAAGDVERAAALVTNLVVPMYRIGRVATLQRWVEWFDARGAVERHAPLAIGVAWVCTLTGDTAGAVRWTDVAQRATFDGPMPDGSPSFAPWLASLRAIRCAHGVAQMRADAERALEELPSTSFWYPVTLFLRGVAEQLSGEPEAERHLAEAADVGETARANPTTVWALAEIAGAASSRRDWAAADAAIERARQLIEQAHLEGYITSIPVFAVGARLAARRSDHEQAREDLLQAQRLRPMLTNAIPWAAVQVRIELVRSHLALADAVGARMLLREIDDVLRLHPDLGLLGEQVEEVRQQAKGMSGGPAGASALTAAELRLIPYLHTYLSFREIAQRLFVSPNTVKTEAISLYRKLGVSSRGAAMARAEELGLIER
jgi:LuxR family transcriptional regulator, maltose regulon positive regulatory protein